MYKKRGIYYIKIRNKGRIVCKSTGTSIKSIAKVIEAKIRADLAEGKYLDRLPGHKRTVADLLDRFLSEHGPKVSPAMKESYKYSMKHLRPALGGKLCSELNQTDISGYKMGIPTNSATHSDESGHPFGA